MPMFLSLLAVRYSVDEYVSSTFVSRPRDADSSVFSACQIDGFLWLEICLNVKVFISRWTALWQSIISCTKLYNSYGRKSFITSHVKSWWGTMKHANGAISVRKMPPYVDHQILIASPFAIFWITYLWSV